MTKEKLLEIAQIESAQSDTEGDNVINNCMKYYSHDTPLFTGFIIDVLLPAVRDDKEFKRDFVEWLIEKTYAVRSKNGKYVYIKFIDDETIDRGFVGCDLNMEYFTSQMLLGYDLEFCREIIGRENV